MSGTVPANPASPASRARGTYWLETLGCPKNAVDSDKITASLLADGLEPAAGPEHADLVVVNTCAFIEAARAESVDTILELAGQRRSGARLVVTGCLAERSGPELAAALPEVDAVVGFSGEGGLAAYASPGSGLDVAVAAPRRLPIGVRDLLELPRPAPSAPWAYLKIAEGCDRSCAFCAIPSFRGRQRSRPPDAVVAEARALVVGGVAELVLVAQDPVSYGRDAGEPGALVALLRRLDGELADLGLRRIRLVYLYPSALVSPLVNTMLELGTTVEYFDLSLQHADRALLARMARFGSREIFLERLAAIRASAPHAAFRSSFIVGFPGETEAAHHTLLEFLAEAQLDWAGFFAFSSEDGTPAATMDGHVEPDLVAERLRECDEIQAPITAAHRDALVGTHVDVLVDRRGADGGAVGRTHREAPEIDGVVTIAGHDAEPGTVLTARVTAALGTDLAAEIVPDRVKPNRVIVDRR